MTGQDRPIITLLDGRPAKTLALSVAESKCCLFFSLSFTTLAPSSKIIPHVCKQIPAPAPLHFHPPPTSAFDTALCSLQLHTLSHGFTAFPLHYPACPLHFSSFARAWFGIVAAFDGSLMDHGWVLDGWIIAAALLIASLRASFLHKHPANTVSTGDTFAQPARSLLPSRVSFNRTSLSTQLVAHSVPPVTERLRGRNRPGTPTVGHVFRLSLATQVVTFPTVAGANFLMKPYDPCLLLMGSRMSPQNPSVGLLLLLSGLWELGPAARPEVCFFLSDG